METVTIIKVQTIADLADLEPDQNFIVLVSQTNEIFRGDGENAVIQIPDAKKPVFYSRIFLYE